MNDVKREMDDGKGELEDGEPTPLYLLHHPSHIKTISHQIYLIVLFGRV